MFSKSNLYTNTNTHFSCGSHHTQKLHLWNRRWEMCICVFWTAPLCVVFVSTLRIGLSLLSMYILATTGSRVVVPCTTTFYRYVHVCTNLDELWSGVLVQCTPESGVLTNFKLYPRTGTGTCTFLVRHSVSPYVNFTSIPIPNYCRPCA
jgi:hypothetical protein